MTDLHSHPPVPDSLPDEPKHVEAKATIVLVLLGLLIAAFVV